MEPEPPGAGADPSRSEPESAPGPWPSGAGAAQKSGGSATLVKGMHEIFRQGMNIKGRISAIRPNMLYYVKDYFYFALIISSIST